MFGTVFVADDPDPADVAVAVLAAVDRWEAVVTAAPTAAPTADAARLSAARASARRRRLGSGTAGPTAVCAGGKSAGGDMKGDAAPEGERESVDGSGHRSQEGARSQASAGRAGASGTAALNCQPAAHHGSAAGVRVTCAFAVGVRAAVTGWPGPACWFGLAMRVNGGGSVATDLSWGCVSSMWSLCPGDLSHS
ncbi:hypothetical protein [Frankia sp. Cppng1_Ct_nod]|uniref:hypothetical protein n=1 Tax=Frankia sp. Cppng1_Ct_nod TaxID=2897162 RepID=UPI001A93E03E|nr:hypothetical protein [Frankia sp. Cppng1_Ct_nod]